MAGAEGVVMSSEGNKKWSQEPQTVKNSIENVTKLLHGLRVQK